VAKVAAVTRWCLKTGSFRIRSLYLGGDDEDDGLDFAIWEYGVWSSGSILYFPFFVESFVIDFAIVEFHQLLSQKKKEVS
jgi:hypothetical protein